MLEKVKNNEYVGGAGGGGDDGDDGSGDDEVDEGRGDFSFSIREIKSSWFGSRAYYTSE